MICDDNTVLRVVVMKASSIMLKMLWEEFTDGVQENLTHTHNLNKLYVNSFRNDQCLQIQYINGLTDLL